MNDTNKIITNPEDTYWNKIKPNEDILLSLVKKSQDYSWYEDIYTQHNCSGVISMLNRSNNILSGYGL